MVKVIALKPHSPDGVHKYKTGDVYSISEQSARLLIWTGRVKIYKSEESEESPPKRVYKRRDMQPE